MAYVQVKPVAIVRGEENQILEKLEFIIDGSSDLSDLPECAPGSVAYKADLSYLAQYDGTTWTQIGG